MKVTPIQMKQSLLSLTAVIALLGAVSCYGTAISFNVTSGSWNTAANWSPAQIPGANDTVTIPSGDSVTGLGAAQSCASLSVSGNLTVDNGLVVSGATTVNSGGTATIISTTGTKSFSGDVAVDASGTWNNSGNAAVTFGGNLTVNGTFNAGTGAQTFSGSLKTISGSTTISLSSANLSGSYTGSGTLNISGTLTLGGTLLNNGTLSFGGTSGSGTLTQGTGANLNDTQSNGSAPSFTLVATASGNTVTYTGSGPAYKATTYQNLTFSGSGSAAQSWPTTIVNGTLTVGGSVSCPNISGTFGALTINDTTGNVTANNAITVVGNLNVTSGILYAQSGLLTVSGTTTINGGTLELGNSGATFTGDFAISSGVFNSSFSGQNPAVGFSGNLTVSGGTFTAGTGVHTFGGSGKTFTGAISIPKVTVNGTYANAGTLTVSTALAGSGTLTQNANSALNIGGTSASLTLAATANTPNTVAYTSGSAQTVLAITYNNLSFSGAGTKTLGGATTVNNTLTISAGTLADGGFTLNANAGVVNSGTHSGPGKISLNGGLVSHSLSGTGAYGNIELNDANGASIASGTSTVNGTLTLTSGTLSGGGGALTLGNSAAISRAAGILSLTPTFGTSLNVTYNDVSTTATGPELPTSTTVLNNLTISNAAGVTLSASATLKGTLTLSSGQLITGLNMLTVTSAGTISVGSGYVNGTLSRGFTTGSGKSATFPVGDGSVYAPVNLASATVTTAGNLVVSTIANKNSQGAFASSGLSQNKYVNRDWSITAANGYAESAGGITLNFMPGDIQGGMSTTADYVAKYSGGVWTKPTVANRTATSITVSGITSFSDWVIGELPVPSFSNLSSKTISYGSSSLSLTGTLSANSGTAHPVVGSTVSVSINGHSVNGAVTDNTGDFTINYNDPSLATEGVGGSPYSITYSFAGDANLASAASDASTELTVNKALLTITANSKTKTYGSAITLDDIVDFAASGLQNGETIGSVTLTPSGGTAATDSVSGSPYTITPSAAVGGTFNPNNYAITYNSGTLTVNPLPVSLTGSRPYDGTEDASSAILSVANAVGGDNVMVASGTGNLQGKNVPAQTIASFGALTLGNNDAGNYTLTGASGSIAIIPVNVSIVSGITADDKSYDGTNMATISITNTATFAGVVSGDEVNLDTNGYNAIFTSVNVDTNVAVTVSGLALDGTDATNYVLVQPVILAADITPALLTLTGLIADDKVYDGTTNATVDISGATLVGVVGSDTNEVVLDTNAVTAAFADPNVGTNKLVTVNGFVLSGSATNNYTLTEPTATANITPIILIVNGLMANGKVYDQTTTATIDATVVTLAGVVGGDDVALDTNGYSATFASAEVGTNITVTVSGLNLGGTSAGNYELTQPLTLLANITPLTVTPIISVADKFYDGTTVATIAGQTLDGVLGSDDVSLVPGFSAGFNDKNAGSNKSVIITGLSLTGAASANYSLASGAAITTASIIPSAIVVTAESNTKQYDGNISAAAIPTITSGSLQTGDTAGFTETYADASAGTNKTVLPLGTVNDGNNGSNYSYTFVDDTTGIINPASLTVLSGVTANDKVYDGTVVATISTTNTVVFSGLVDGDYVTLDTNGYRAAFASVDVNTNKTVTVSGLTLDGANAANYTLAQPTGLTAAIAPAPLAVTGITASDKAYDGTTNVTIDASGASLVGVVAGDTNNVSLETNTVTAAFADPNAGTNKPVIVSGLTLSGSAANNYTLTQPTVTASINPAPLTITADSQARTQGLPNPVLTASYSGFVNNEDTNALTAQAVLSTVAAPESPAGIYQITASGATAVNYTITFTDGTLTVVSPPALSSESIEGNQVVFSFPSLAGQTYQLESSTNLAEAIWVPVGNLLSGSGSQISVTNDIVDPQMYFRLQIQQQ